MKISDRLTSFMHDRLANEHKDPDYKAAFESEQIKRELDRATSMIRRHPLDPPILRHRGNDGRDNYGRDNYGQDNYADMAEATKAAVGAYREANSCYGANPMDPRPTPATSEASDDVLDHLVNSFIAPEAPEEAFDHTAKTLGNRTVRTDMPTGHYRTPTPAEPKNPKYSSLHTVLKAAYDQASKGKGSERHGNGKAFEDQPMQSISNLLGSTHGMAFQAIKKIKEAEGMETFEQKERELLGAINYIAGIIIFEKEKAS
jgi:hypothetical protein